MPLFKDKGGMGDPRITGLCRTKREWATQELQAFVHPKPRQKGSREVGSRTIGRISRN